MSTLDQARETQLRNIETRTGKTLAQLRAALQASGLGKHGELRSYAMTTFGLGQGDANTLVHLALASDGQSAAQAAGLSGEDVIAGIYSEKKAPLRPIHDRLMAEKPGGMCQFKVKVAGTHEVDAELVGWLRQAYDAAG